MAKDWPTPDFSASTVRSTPRLHRDYREKKLRATVHSQKQAERNALTECHLWWHMRRRRRRRKNHRKVTTGEGLFQRLVCETGF